MHMLTLIEDQDRKDTANEDIESIIEQFVAAIGPYYTDDEKIIKVILSHDRGMRFIKILDKISFKNPNEEKIKKEKQPIFQNGTYVHRRIVSGVVFEWPARRISLGHGQYQFI